MQRIVDRVIAGAAAEIAFQQAWQVIACILVERRGGHDHAGRAIAALKGLRIEECLLHGMKLAVSCEALDGRDLAPLSAKGGYQAAMIGHAVEPDGAGAAIALVAALLDAEPAMVAQLIQCDGIHAEKLAPKPNAVTTVRLERLYVEF